MFYMYFHVLFDNHLACSLTFSSEAPWWVLQMFLEMLGGRSWLHCESA